MTVNELIVHHRYDSSVAVDRSGHRNHGRLVGVWPDSRGLRFDLGADRVQIDPSPTLQRMLAVAVEVDMTLDPTAGTRRHNLVESHASFALFCNPNGSVQATVYDGRGNWPGAISTAGVVKPGVTHRVRMMHDGAACLTIWVDGTQVAQSFDALGPVSGVKSLGCAVGHWPDPGDQYTFHGWIAGVKIWRFNPDRGATHFVDRCCIDSTTTDTQATELLSEASASGIDADQLRRTIDQLVEIGARNFGRLAAGSPARRDQARSWARAVSAAIAQGDRDSLVATIGDAATDLAATTNSTDIADDAAEVQKLLSELPLGHLPFSGETADNERLATMFDAWCWDWVRAPRRPKRPTGEHEERPHEVSDDSDPDRPDLRRWSHDG